MRLIKLIPEDTKIPFMGARLVTFPISMVLVAASFLVMAILAIAVLVMGLYPKPFTDVTDASVSHLLQHVSQSKLR